MEKITPILQKYFKDPEITDKIINYENLSVDLPAHNIDVPWHIEGEMSSDILTQDQMTIFINYLDGKIIKAKHPKARQKTSSYSNKELMIQILINIRNKFRLKINERK